MSPCCSEETFQHTTFWVRTCHRKKGHCISWQANICLAIKKDCGIHLCFREKVDTNIMKQGPERQAAESSLSGKLTLPPKSMNPRVVSGNSQLLGNWASSLLKWMVLLSLLFKVRDTGWKFILCDHFHSSKYILPTHYKILSKGSHTSELLLCPMLSTVGLWGIFDILGVSGVAFTPVFWWLSTHWQTFCLKYGQCPT
jgi:hypothetical protein